MQTKPSVIPQEIKDEQRRPVEQRVYPAWATALSLAVMLAVGMAAWAAFA